MQCTSSDTPSPPSGGPSGAVALHSAAARPKTPQARSGMHSTLATVSAQQGIKFKCTGGASRSAHAWHSLTGGLLTADDLAQCPVPSAPCHRAHHRQATSAAAHPDPYPEYPATTTHLQAPSGPKTHPAPRCRRRRRRTRHRTCAPPPAPSAARTQHTATTCSRLGGRGEHDGSYVLRGQLLAAGHM